MIFIYIIMGLIILIIIYLRMLKPYSKRKDKMKPFENVYIAHRGAHTLVVPENSMQAFQRAINAGNGIELDVRLTKDGIPVVFHDNNLMRVCGVQGKVSELTYDILKEYHLAGSNQTIPTLEEALKLIQGKVPVIIEIKSCHNNNDICSKVVKVLNGYKGVYCIQSFYSRVLIWFRRNYPEVLRGQLTSDVLARGVPKGPIISGITTRMLNNWITKPDFLSCCHKDTQYWIYRLCRKLYNPVCAGWTIRSDKELEEAQKVFNIIICDKK